MAIRSASSSSTRPIPCFHSSGATKIASSSASPSARGPPPQIRRSRRRVRRGIRRPRRFAQLERQSRPDARGAARDIRRTRAKRGAARPPWRAGRREPPCAAAAWWLSRESTALRPPSRAATRFGCVINRYAADAAYRIAGYRGEAYFPTIGVVFTISYLLPVGRTSGPASGFCAHGRH
jgi:hypothetical protein